MAEVMTTAAVEQWMRSFGVLVANNRDLLTCLDAAIGDADHGSNMHRGMTAALSEIDRNKPLTSGALLSKVGMTLVSTMGGASGPLFGTLFFRMGGSLGELSQTTPDLFGKALRAGLEGVVSRGRAEPGDKTMFDALSPGVTAFEGAVSHGAALGPAAARASAAAAAGRDATAPMVARKGRASYLGERSVGHVDPGAASVALLFEAATLAF